MVLTVVVNQQGNPENVRVTKSLDKGLDAQAVAAIQQWTFEPGTKDGKPVAVAATIQVNFKVQ